MKVLVLKDFPYAKNGLKNEVMVEGTEVEIRDEFVEGLEKEGFIVVDLPKPHGDGAPTNYETMTKKDLEEAATARGISFAGASKKELVALFQRADQVDVLLLTSNYTDLADAELAKVAADRKVEVPAGASREDIIALLMPATS